MRRKNIFLIIAVCLGSIFGNYLFLAKAHLAKMRAKKAPTDESRLAFRKEATVALILCAALDIAVIGGSIIVWTKSRKLHDQ